MIPFSVITLDRLELYMFLIDIIMLKLKFVCDTLEKFCDKQICRDTGLRNTGLGGHLGGVIGEIKSEICNLTPGAYLINFFYDCFYDNIVVEP
jgi:hypothetical protein